MKTVVITGSSRGLGFEMAKEFLKKNYHVVICGTSPDHLEKARQALAAIPSEGKLLSIPCDVTNTDQISSLITTAVSKFKQIDIWINNAGINQPDRPIWELSEHEITRLIDVDLKAAVLGSKLIMKQMITQGHGAIYNIEGYGSNDAMMTGLSVYGTSKRAITYFTQALAKESEERKTGVLVGRLSPGIMITDFIKNALGSEQAITLSDKTKKVYNILGDKPDVVAAFLVNGMIHNTKNNAKIVWLTNRKAAWRFMTAGFHKRDMLE